ncbi:SEC-C metal-binding domain-containing protein [Nocardia sp. NPDC059246]|uniref:SEC-C metal-binding domain-containing protein n=1 Tax=Nocardia sp. NPDC059246 TaxID=3346789 RepID=UPI0036CDAC54
MLGADRRRYGGRSRRVRRSRKRGSGAGVHSLCLCRWLSRNGQGRSWPPARNESCWCGSAQKYKKYCGRPG